MFSSCTDLVEMLAVKKKILVPIIAFLLLVGIYTWSNYLPTTSEEEMQKTQQQGKVDGGDGINDGFVHVHIQKELIKVFYREVNPLDAQLEHANDDDEEKPLKIDVLLLHGMRFTSKNWAELNTLSILGQHGHRAIAVDLPGYGQSEPHASLQGDTDTHKAARASFLGELIEVLGLLRPAIVSPSMSGSFSLPFLMHDPSKIGAFVPVAPVHSERFSPEDYMRTNVRTLIVYGELDKRLGLVSLHNLSYLPKHKVSVLPKANHAAYLDQPELWHQVLTTFLDSEDLVVQ